MTSQPIGATAYTEIQATRRLARRIDVARYQQNIAEALNADESRAIEDTFGGTPNVSRAKASGKQPTLGRHIDIRA